jgi:hypothetical protein
MLDRARWLQSHGCAQTTRVRRLQFPVLILAPNRPQQTPCCRRNDRPRQSQLPIHSVKIIQITPKANLINLRIQYRSIDESPSLRACFVIDRPPWLWMILS